MEGLMALTWVTHQQKVGLPSHPSPRIIYPLYTAGQDHSDSQLYHIQPVHLRTHAGQNLVTASDWGGLVVSPE